MATSSSSSRGQTSELMTIAVGYGGASSQASERYVTPNVTMNYTVVLSRIDATVTQVALSAVSKVSGVTADLSQNEFTFLGREEVVVLRLSVDQTVSSPDVQIDLIATAPQGITNSSLSFTLNKGLIVIESLDYGLAKPSTLHVKVGQPVTWIQLIEIDDDGNGFTNVRLADGSAASPTMNQYDVWSHTFDRPGTYAFQVTSVGYVSSSGVVEVSQ